MMKQLLSIALLIPIVIAAPLRGLVSNGYETRDATLQLQVPEPEILISAADFVVPVGVKLDQSSEGSQNLAQIVTGDKLSFTVNLEVGGLHRMQTRISNANNVGAFVVVNAETREIYGQVDVLPPTASWEQWATVRVGDAYLPAGVQTFEILVIDGGFNLGWFSLTRVSEDIFANSTGTNSTGVLSSATPTHFLVAARDFIWAEGLTVDPINGNLGESNSGDYVKYEINIPVLGVYAIHVEVSSPYGRGSFVAKNSDTQQIYGEVKSIPETGGWHVWTSVSIENITFEPGLVPFEILVVEGGWNMMHFSVDLTSTPGVNATNATDDVHILVPSASLNSSAGVEAEAPQIIGNISNAAFMIYNVDVPVAGNYRLDLKVASMNGTGAFLVTNSETDEVYGVVDSIPATGGWDSYTTVSLDDIDLVNGTVPLEIIVMEGSFNFLFMSLELNEIADISDASDTTTNSGNLLFGNSTTGNDTSANDTLGNFMIHAADYVDADGVVKEDPFNVTETVGSIDTGDTIDYDFNVSTAGSYRLDLGIASLLPQGSFMVINRETQEVYGQLDTVPATGDWYKWQRVSVGTVELPAGTVPLRVVAIVGGWNLMWLSLEPVIEADSNSTLPRSIPSAKFFFPASKYDSMYGIELEPSSEGGDNVGSIDAGDWVTYQVDLPSSGNYKAEMRVASNAGLGSLQFANGNSNNVYGTVDVPLTGWWQIYTTVSLELNLPGGSYPLRIRAREGGWNFLWFSLEKMEDSR